MIVLDVLLPDGNGLELLEQTQGRSRHGSHPGDAAVHRGGSGDQIGGLPPGPTTTSASPTIVPTWLPGRIGWPRRQARQPATAPAAGGPRSVACGHPAPQEDPGRRRQPDLPASAGRASAAGPLRGRCWPAPGQEALDLLQVQPGRLHPARPDHAGDVRPGDLPPDQGVAGLAIDPRGDADGTRRPRGDDRELQRRGRRFRPQVQRLRRAASPSAAQLRRRQFEEENRRIREQLHHKDIEVAEARAAHELAETRAALLADLQRKNAELEQTHQGMAQAEERVRRQNAILEAINRIFREGLVCQTEQELGGACLAVAEHLTASKFGFIAMINSQTGLLDDIAISAPDWQACRMEDRSGHGQTLRTGFAIRGIHGRVVLDGKGFFTNDPPSHPDSIGVPAGHPPLTAFLGVPLAYGGQIIGMVGLGNREGGYSRR